MEKASMNAEMTITTGGRITIPRVIREALGIAPGDHLAWDLDGDGVVRVRRVEAHDPVYLDVVQRVAWEWSSAEDEMAFRDL